MGWGARFAGVLVVGLALSACGGAGPEGQALRAASAEPTSSPSPTASATEASGTAQPTPESMATPESSSGDDEHSAQGAAAFVRQWIEAANKAFRTGNVEEWRSLGSPSCKTCAARIQSVEVAYGRGGRIGGGQLTVVDLLPSPLREGETPLVVADLKASAERHYDGDGKLLDKFPAERTKLVFLMAWVNGGWTISEIKLGDT